MASAASSSSCESSSSCSSISHCSVSSSISNRTLATRKVSQSSHCHTDETLERLLTSVKSPLMQLSSPDQVFRTMTHEKSTPRLQSQYNHRHSSIAAKVTDTSRQSSPRLSLKMGLLIPSRLSLSTVKMHARMKSVEFPRIKKIASHHAYLIEGEHHQYHHAITNREYDAYMTENHIELDYSEDPSTDHDEQT